MRKISVGVVKFTSCSGCINEVLYALVKEPEFMKLIEFREFREFQDDIYVGEYDVLIVEGSISTKHQEEMLHDIRKRSGVLISLGTCATFGGVQALRINHDIDEVVNSVYPLPHLIEVNESVKAVDEVVKVDYRVRGCPVNGDVVARILKKVIFGGGDVAIPESLCSECKRAGINCVMVSKGIPCLGPIVSAGCGAICPRFGRGCYGCYGLRDDVNSAMLESLAETTERYGLFKDDLLTYVKAYSYSLFKSKKLVVSK